MMGGLAPLGEPTISTHWMPALFALALCEACSQPQAQTPSRPADLPASPASTRAPEGAAAAASARAIDEGAAATSVDHSSNRQPRTDAR